MKYEEKCKTKNVVYTGKILNVRRDEVVLPNGRTSVREIVEHRGGVGILPVRCGRVLLVEQFRYAYGESLLEIPAGKREGEESFEDCGRRELTEETGLVARELVSLGILYPSPGYTGEKIAIYYADEFESGERHLDEDEFVDVKEIPFAEAKEMVLSGRIRDAKTIAAILKYDALKRDSGD